MLALVALTVALPAGVVGGAPADNAAPAQGTPAQPATVATPSGRALPTAAPPAQAQAAGSEQTPPGGEAAAETPLFVFAPELAPRRETIDAGARFSALPRFGAAVFARPGSKPATTPETPEATPSSGEQRTTVPPTASAAGRTGAGPSALTPATWTTSTASGAAGAATVPAPTAVVTNQPGPAPTAAMSAGTPAQGLAVPANYVLGGGDVLDLQVWSRGRAQQSAQLSVSAEGLVFLPVAGRLSVAGQTLQQVREAVTQLFGRFYDHPQVTLVLSSQRAVDVYVLGDVTEPGKYTLSGMVTVFTALYAAGGPSTSGSYRQVRLERLGEKPQLVDLYDYLLKGERKGDVLLQTGDTLFVPPARLEIGVAGEVRRPARYEFTAPTTLAEVLDMSGGLGPQAYAPAIEVWRTGDHRGWQLTNLDARQNAAVTLQDGDLVVVKPLLGLSAQTVTVRGAVNRPGSYAFVPGLTVGQLLTLAEGFADGASTQHGILWRLQEDMSYALERLGSGVAGSQSGADVVLRPRDIVYVPKQEEPTVSVTGEVRRPGLYPFGPGMRVADLIALAGGLTPQAFTSRANLTRWQQPSQQPALVAVDLQAALGGDATANALLQQQDVLDVKAQATAVTPSKVHIDGFVQTPGDYPYYVGMKVSDLVFAAGSPLPQASGIECARGRTPGDIRTEHLKIVGPAETFRVDPDPVLGPDDRVSVQGDGRFVASAPAVLLKGQVATQGAYALLGETQNGVWSVLQRAGGLLPDADGNGIVIYRGLPEIFTQMRELGQMLSSYNRESLVAQEKTGQLAAATQQAMTEQLNTQLAQVLSAQGEVSVVVPPRRLQLEQSVQAIPVDGERLFASQGKQGDVLLAPGDIVTVPKRRDTVTVVGAVVRPGAIPYQAAFTERDYVAQAGGLAIDAALDRALVLAPNGSVRPRTPGLRVQAGDVVVVPSQYVVQTRRTDSTWERALRALSTAVALAIGL